ncbi:MAG: FtsX-like permease family protein [Clostridiales bacterium]|nr:FtsX-like permease family protein [Clostridiales bacterium]
MMLLICIIAASFVAALSFDMTNSLKNVLRAGFASMFGNGNAIVSYSQGIDDKAFAGTEDIDYDSCKVAVRQSKIYKRDDEMYAYYNEKTLMTYGADSKSLNDLKLIGKTIEIGDDECVISKKYAEDFDLKPGSKVSIYGDNFVAVEYTVKEIVPYYGVVDGGYAAVLNEEGMKKLSYDGSITYQMAYVHVNDESRLPEFCDILQENMPTAQIENLVNGKMVTSQINQFAAIFYFLFAICVLLVVFVTISLSERIMVERMSTIGTLRSLGVSSKATTFIVLLENALYGLIGGAIGVGVYTLVRDPLFNGMFTVNSGSDIALEMDIGKVSPFVIVGVVLGTILIECLCPIKELLRAVKTPIRDIIFDNKDTDFKYGKKSLVASIVLALIGIPAAILGFQFFAENALVLIVGVLCTIAALFLGYPHILRAVCKLAARFFEKRNKPVAQLACVQACTKKASVGNSRLCVMAAAVCMILLLLIASYQTVVNYKDVDCDVIVSGLSEDSTKYSFFKDLEGVSDVEFVYFTYSYHSVIGTERIEEYLASDRSGRNSDFEFDDNYFYGANGKSRMCNMVLDMPETVNDDEIYITKKVAKEMNLSIGDELEILFKPQSMIPVRQKFVVAGFVNTTNLEMMNTSFLISENTFKKIYFDTPAMALIRCEDPEKTVAMIDKYASSMIDEVRTFDQRLQDIQQQNAGLSTLLYLMIIMGVGLTLVAVFSNQTVGFEGRKRESAVLISTSMSRGKLCKAFLIENAFSSLTAILLGVGVAVFLNADAINLIRSMKMEFPMTYDPKLIIGFALMMFLVFTMTVINPIRHLRKMKTAEQLKYE